MKSITLFLISILTLTACQSSPKDYSQSEWYKSSRRQHKLPDEFDWTEIPSKRSLKLEETTQTAGLRMTSNSCPMRTAPNTDAPILKKLKRGQKLWTEDNGGEWYRVFKKTGYAFVNKTCFIASSKNYFIKK